MSRVSETRSRRPDDESGDSPIGIDRVLGGLGLLAVLAGTAVILAPELGAGFSPGYVIVFVIGGLLLVIAATRWRDRLVTSIESATLPDVEERSTVSVPGADFDAMLRGGTGNSIECVKQRSKIRSRVETVTTAVLDDRPTDNIDVADRLADGTWTDDPVAAALFTDADESLSIRTRITSFVTGRSVFRRRVERAIDELFRLVDGERDPDAADGTHTETKSPTPPGEWVIDRWKGLSALALSVIGFGVVFSRPALLLGGGVLAGFGAYVVAGPSPDPELSITRTLEPTEPRPGESVTVRVEIENVGESFQSDLRFVDGVPAGVTVVDGTPRHGTALRPGASTTYTYSIEAVRGSHEFETPTLVARNLPGTLERVSKPDVDGDGTVTYDVSTALELSVPLRKHTSKHVGRVLTDVGGSGIEFHSVREYRRGDPLTRIDWNRAARGEGLATLQFREERSATVVVLIDARRSAYVAPDDEAASAVDRSVLAAAKVVSALLDSDDRVGLASLSPRRCWLEPGAGHTHRARAHDLLASHESFAPSPPETPYYVRINLAALRKRLPGDAQLLVFSPVADDESVEIVRQLEASGYPVTLLSPDATGGGTPGRRLERLERSVRLSRLRQSNVRVVDWDDEEPLALALTNAARRWS
ncbi:DUF58 domain-containing protein [Halorhabdus amylolytica]|uniref:DUF58 domain-containing protein n=1 Tax=Halorhabdus amylolytica TaxID=2559573 RepID=UPI0010AA0AD4|nr:DUF58 domain-containing protein [Halorhabdus amylolytica]